MLLQIKFEAFGVDGVQIVKPTIFIAICALLPNTGFTIPDSCLLQRFVHHNPNKHLGFLRRSMLQGSFLSAVALILLAHIEAIDLLEYHKQAFEKSFHDKCDKYPFVQRYIDKMEHSDERYFTFVYQEPSLRNGGLGDKIGGLISAVAMALRFNRTLIVRSQNHADEVFRPYHPTDIHAKDPVYTWDKFTQWSNYDWKYANNDATEYDLYDCVNHPGQRNSHCSMDYGDASNPHILFRANRCYLCYYDNHKDTVAYHQMNALGVNSTSDLFEVAGCMMRLALWPTELLWQEVGKQLSAFESTLAPAVRRQRRRLRTRRMDESKLAEVPGVVQVGMHFRCGDKSYIKKGGFDHMCVYDEGASDDEKKALFPLGNPYSMGVCARHALHSYLTAELLAPATTLSTASNDSAVTQTAPLAPAHISETDLNEHMRSLNMGFLASDNEMASMQMNHTLGLAHSIVSPQGCHVEMDMTKQCHMFTVSQWLLLSFSDILVTQEGIPSSFSKYAGLYGLKADPFRNGKNCGSAQSNMELSRKPMSNWFC